MSSIIDKEEDCYNCEHFFPRYNCPLRLPYVGRERADYPCRYGCPVEGQVFCTEFIPRITLKQLTLF